MRYKQLLNEDVDEKLRKYIKFPTMKLSDFTVVELINRYGNTEPMTVYRGMNFKNKHDYDTFINSIKNGKLTLYSMSSWSRSREEALNFAITRPTFDLSSDLAKDVDIAKSKGESLIGYRGIILKTHINEHSAIDVSKTNYMAEDEIILPSGTYHVSFNVFKKYSELIDVENIDDIVLTTINKPEMTDTYMKKFTDYIIKRYPHKLKEETINSLLEKYGGYSLSVDDINLVDIDDPYFEKELKIKFNPWLFIFLDNGLLPKKIEHKLIDSGKKIIDYVSSLIKNKPIRLRSSGIKQLSDLIDDGKSYDMMIRSTIKPTSNTKDINKMKGREKKDAIQRERERLQSMLSDIE